MQAFADKLQAIWDTHRVTDPFLDGLDQGQIDTLKETWAEMNFPEFIEEVLDTAAEPFVGVLALQVMDALIDKTDGQVAATDLEAPVLEGGTWVIDGDLNIEELGGPVVVLGDLTVNGTIVLEDCGPPLWVAGNLKCQGFHSDSAYSIVLGDLDAGDFLFINGGDWPCLVGGDIKARIAWGTEGKLRLWNPKGVIKAQHTAMDLSEEGDDAWWAALQDQFSEPIVERNGYSVATQMWEAWQARGAAVFR